MPYPYQCITSVVRRKAISAQGIEHASSHDSADEQGVRISQTSDIKEFYVIYHEQAVLNDQYIPAISYNVLYIPSFFHCVLWYYSLAIYNSNLFSDLVSRLFNFGLGVVSMDLKTVTALGG